MTDPTARLIEGRKILWIALVVALVVPVAGALAQPSLPREIHPGDLIQRYVPEGTVVVTTGHLAYVNQQALLNPAMPSAMMPAIVDITRLPTANRDLVQAQCAAVQITSGGCRAKVHGQVRQIDTRPGLVATHIELLAPVR
jgi:hypothetical protein